MYHEGKGCRYQLVLLLLILRCLIIQFYHSVAIYQVKNIFLLIMHQNFEVKLIYHYCISIKHCGDKITGDVFFHEILLKFPHTFHTILICSVRYDTFSIRYDTFLARYDTFLLVYQSRMLLMRFLCAVVRFKICIIYGCYSSLYVSKMQSLQNMSLI